MHPVGSLTLPSSKNPDGDQTFDRRRDGHRLGIHIQTKPKIFAIRRFDIVIEKNEKNKHVL
jgi:hypothetical protein